VKRLTAAAVVAALTAVAAASCGGGDDERAAASSIGEARLATTDPKKNGVDIRGGEERDGLVIGIPRLRPGDDLSPPPAAVAAAGAACSGTTLLPAPTNLAGIGRATLCLLNAERAARSLRPLRANARLASAARVHASDMVAKRYFAHDSQSGADFSSRIKRSGYFRGARGWTVGENLAWGTSTAAQPREIVQAWMNSPGHRANILNARFREIGVGVVVGAPNGDGAGATYATEFGTRFR